MSDTRTWAREAIRIIEADFQRSADTHLIPLALPGLPGVELYFKDESSHPTGSLKHRLARSLFLYALCNGWLKPGAPVIEASSGSTAISEAYFARLLGLPFIAVMPASTSKEKIAQIAFYGGQSHLVQDPTQIYAESERLVRETGGHFMDQFTYAERATDWRANNNIAESIFQQLRSERFPEPSWLVSSPGTGGTLATLGRYVRYRRHSTQVLCADAERSVFFDYYCTGDASLCLNHGSRIEGIGRPRVEASFLPSVIDAMCKVPDALSLAAMHYLAQRLGRKVGGSSGTNLIGALLVAQRMVAAGESGSVVAILCDGGERYADTYYDQAWLSAQGFELTGLIAAVADCAERGVSLPGDLPVGGGRRLLGSGWSKVTAVGGRTPRPECSRRNAMGIARSCLHMLLWSVVGLSVAVLAADDTAWSKDHPLLSRYPNSHIVEYEQNYNAAQFATGTQDGVPQRQTVEGDATQIRYFHNAVDSQPSPLQLLRNYQNAIKSIGGEVVYERLPQDGDGGETTLKVTTGGKQVWVRLEPEIFSAPTQSYKLVIVEVAAMQQVVTANQLLDELNRNGFIVSAP